MSQGIALKFKNIDSLIRQEKQLTEVASLKMNDKWVLYLITKEKYYEKPLYADIFKTLQNTKLFCIKNNITTLALPKISCGLDKKRLEYYLYFAYHKNRISKNLVSARLKMI
jgi:hypothetical protein